MANYNTNYEKVRLQIFQRIEGLKNLEFQAGTTLARNIRTSARKTFGNGKSGYPYEFHDSLSRQDVVDFKEEIHAVVIDKPRRLVETLEYGLSGDLTITAKNGEYMRFEGKYGDTMYMPEVTIPKSSRKPTDFIGSAIEETKKDLKKIYKDSIDMEKAK